MKNGFRILAVYLQQCRLHGLAAADTHLALNHQVRHADMFAHELQNLAGVVDRGRADQLKALTGVVEDQIEPARTFAASLITAN